MARKMWNAPKPDAKKRVAAAPKLRRKVRLPRRDPRKTIGIHRALRYSTQRVPQELAGKTDIKPAPNRVGIPAPSGSMIDSGAAPQTPSN